MSTHASDGVRLTPVDGYPGRVTLAPAPVTPELGGREIGSVTVRNASAWPVVITSHYHFFEANRYLEFDRAAAFGMHLDLPAGQSVRFDPGEVKSVELISYGGDRAVYGFNGLCNATLSDPASYPELKRAALDRLRAAGYRDTGSRDNTGSRDDTGPPTAGSPDAGGA